MEWSEDGIVLGTRRHGESSVILEVMTSGHGRHMGLVRGGRSRRMQPMLQPGNTLSLTWRARLDEHLGNFQAEPVALRAARLMETASGIHGVQVLAAHLRLLPERDPHPRLFEAFHVILDHLNDPVDACVLLARFEIALLDDLGFGLDLTECAATGTTQDLIWVSPKSGRAVSREPGRPYEDKLLKLPTFLREQKSEGRPGKDDIAAGLELTRYFLDRHIWEPRAIRRSEARAGLLLALEKDSG